MSAYGSIRQHTAAYVSIRQHMSAYVSIRQHTSAYVSIRQHTSAYGSVHLCRPLKEVIVFREDEHLLSPVACEVYAAGLICVHIPVLYIHICIYICVYIYIYRVRGVCGGSDMRPHTRPIYTYMHIYMYIYISGARCMRRV
jgi:hypothetical protein